MTWANATRASLPVVAFALACNQPDIAPNLSVVTLSSVWTEIAAAPVLAPSPDDLWSGISGMAIRPDGTLLYSDVGLGAILRTDSLGRVVERQGRRGFGPGENQYVQWFGQCPDSSLLVYDPPRNQVSILSLELTVMETISVPADLRGQLAIGCADRRSLVFAAEPQRLSGYGEQRWPTTVVAWRLLDGALDTLGHLPGRDVFVSERFSATIQVPLGVRTHLTAGRAGVFWARSDEDTVWRHKEKAPVPLQLRDLPASTRATDAMTADAEAAVLWDFPEKRDRDLATRVLREMPQHRDAPRIARLVAADDSSVWVGLSAVGDGSRLWLKYGANGRSISFVRLPASFVLLASSAVCLAGFTRDSLGTEQPAAYRLMALPSANMIPAGQVKPRGAVSTTGSCRSA